MSEQYPVAVQGALGRTSRPRSVDDDRRVLRPGGDRLEDARGVPDQAVESARRGALTIDQDNVLQPVQLLAQSRDNLEVLEVGHDHLSPAVSQPETQGLLPEEREEGDDDGAQL